jgi:putative transposase
MFLYMTSPESIRTLFQKVAPKSFFDGLCHELDLHCRDCIYTTDVTCWLMMLQWIGDKCTLSASVQSLIEERPQRLKQCKRVREDRVSSRTGAYSEARKRLPNQVATKLTDHIFEQLRETMKEGWKGLNRPVFLVDGTTLQLQHEPSLRKAFPAGKNQHGSNHWPVLHLVAFHDVFSGVAMRPSWGAKYGKRAVSEQALAEQALPRLPSNAVVLGDTNFGIFSFAYAVQQSGRPMVLRIQLSRARRMLGREPTAGIDQRLIWKPSKDDRKGHPALPEGAQLEGRLLVFPHPQKENELLCLFTLLELPAQQILDLYGLRWNMELDLRSLKRTIGLYQLKSKSKEMVEKELLMAISAYNLVRAVMCMAASQAGIEPRRLSFSQTQDVVHAALSGLEQATTEEEFQQRLKRMLRRVTECTLPKRPSRRSYPRQVWGQGARFPPRTRTGKTNRAK